MMNSHRRHILSLVVLFLFCVFPAHAELKVHGIFSSNMVIQRDKPIKVWGWAKPEQSVSVQLGSVKAAAKANAQGRWQVVFDARPADATPCSLVVSADSDTITYDNILIGDVWVMNGQSNMAWGMGWTLNADLATTQADMPMLRLMKISANEQQDLQADIPRSAMPYDGWAVSTPETAPQVSAIGFAFATRVQRATGVPIGIIDNARGGASIESLVPENMFASHPLANRYYAHLLQRQAEFDINDQVAKMVEKWEKDIAKKREQGVAEDKLPPKPTAADVRSWNIPGKSPSDAGACYNGMFGAFKGYNIKGVLFHQGYNNAIGHQTRPKRYRVLMNLMVNGWRNDFGENLPVGVIGFCAGGIPQTEENFETWTVSTAAYIREAQRLGLADVGDTEHTAFLPAFDVQIPGLHPVKKEDHGIRAARWALNTVYNMNVDWQTAKLVSAQRVGDEMVLTFDKPVMPHDMSTIPKGFSIAGPDGEFYLGHARFRLKQDQGVWSTANKSYDTTIVHVWSPLVNEPAGVRYGWARSGMGNLYVEGKPWAPLASFRTDDWDLPESEDPTETALTRGTLRAMNSDAEARNAERRQKEAEQAVSILERLKTLGRVEADN